MATLAGSRVTSAELMHLYVVDPTRDIGYRYRHVYPAGPGRWRVMFRAGGRRVWVGTRRTEVEAARLAVCRMRAVYGPDWPRLHRAAVCAAHRRKAAPASRRTKLPAGAG